MSFRFSPRGTVSETTLAADSIHVWRVDLARLSATDAARWVLLDPGERARALRFHQGRRRRRFVACRSALREILSTYLAVEPGAIRFALGRHGKPYVQSDPAGRTVGFNVSHSGDLALIAVGTQRSLGVDVEVWRPVTSMAALVDRCFAEEEASYWSRLPESQRSKAFFDVWTLKEAFVKAVGRGIGLGLKQCAVMPGRPPRLLHVPDDCGDAADWLVQSVDVGAGASGAVAVMGPSVSVRLLDFESSKKGA